MKTYPSWTLRIFLGLALFPFTISNSWALPGQLDTSFGANGVATVDAGSDNETLSGTTIQPDGKIVAVGVTRPLGTNEGLIVRVNEDGSPDASFNAQGFQVVQESGVPINLVAVALQDDGKIVAVGSIEAGDEDVLLVRLNTDGSFDDTFGTQGVVITPVSPGVDRAGGVVVQPDGKIVVGGFSGGDFMALRYLTSGELDSGFNGDGVAITDFDGNNDFGRNVAVQEDGKVVVVGDATMGGAKGFGLVRYDTQGALDGSFGIGGLVFGPNSPGTAGALAVKIQSDQQIVLGGIFFDGLLNDFGIARYNDNGSLDDSFGNNGLTLTPFGDMQSFIQALAIQDDGFIVACGQGLSQIALARYDLWGMLDSGFGNGGTVLTDLGLTSNCGGTALQSDGKIVVAAGAILSQEDVHLLRYLGNTANLTLEKTSSHTSVGLGGRIGFTLNVANEGPNDAGGTWVLDQIPAGLSLDPNSINTNQGSCTAENNDLICDLGTLSNGASATINYSVSADAMGTFLNSASVTAQAINENPDAAIAALTLTVTEASGGCALGGTPLPSGNFWVVFLLLPLGFGMFRANFKME